MKGILISAFAALLITSEDKCNNKNLADGCYKGKLEVKGICSNYTIRVTQGDIDSSLVAASWTDENTGKTYKNVFALDSPCSFPADIEEGEEFYFTIKKEKDKDCNVCMAFYPVPPKRLAITVSKSPCP